jgi:hypothetical protein
MSETSTAAAAQSPFSLDIVCLADVQEREISWLWKPYIPSGKITILEGDPEAGKTFLALEIAAHVTTGRPLPTFGREREEMLPPKNVMFLTAEDDLADTIVPRFRKADGDAARFLAINGIIQRRDDKDVHLGITLSDISLLEGALSKHKPGLLIVDPFQAFIGSKVDFHRANEVRPVMEGIGKLAARHGCAMLLIRHFAKAAYGNVMYRGIGSIDILAAARSVLQAGVNPEPLGFGEMFNVNPAIGIGTGTLTPDGNRFVFVQSKCNVAQKGPTIAYSIADGKLSFKGPVLVTADDIQAGKVKRSPRKSAQEFLSEQLATGKKPVLSLLTAARKEGISESTLRRAAKELPIKRAPSGFGGQWYWEWLVEGRGTADSVCVEGASASEQQSSVLGADKTSLQSDPSATSSQ